jgi:K+:H+ antiporter
VFLGILAISFSFKNYILEMIYLAASNPNLLVIVLLGLIVISLGVVLRYFHQPYVVAYIVAGVLLGEHGFEIITDKEVIATIGEFGLILLLFFIGMETNLPDLLKRWKFSLFGTSTQIICSILIVGLIGYFFNLKLNQIVVLGFVISLSSSAVVIKLLQDNKESQSLVGQNVISILLMQDILIVPMLITTSYLGSEIPEVGDIILQLIGGGLIVGVILWMLKKKEIKLPFGDEIEADHELQVFIAFSVCFGFALITAFFGLSAALGAFVGGIVIHSARSTEWFHDSLHAFRVVFVAIFFISIGMMIDLNFIKTNWSIIGFLILTIYLINHFINVAILYYFSKNWKNSMYGGALLAQIGELSFVLIASAFQANIISDFSYQLTIVIISLTLLISPFWIAFTKKIIGFK